MSSSKFIVPLTLLELGTSATRPDEGFVKLYFNDWLKQKGNDNIELDVVLDRTLEGFTISSTGIEISTADTVLESFVKLQGSLKSITMIGAITGTIAYNVGLGRLELTTVYSPPAIEHSATLNPNSQPDIQHITAAERIDWDSKQEELVSGTNIKTIDSQSLLGSGDITTLQLTTVNVTIAVADWSGGLTCTKTITGITTTSDNDIAFIAYNDQLVWGTNNVFAVETVTVVGQQDFTCVTTPIEDINIKVKIYK